MGEHSAGGSVLVVQCWWCNAIGSVLVVQCWWFSDGGAVLPSLPPAARPCTLNTALSQS
jgi:hypothetical protein